MNRKRHLTDLRIEVANRRWQFDFEVGFEFEYLNYMGGGMGKRLMLAALAAAMLGCSESTAPETALFTVEVSGEQFKVRAEGAAAIAAMQARLQSGQTGVVSGTLVRGNGGFNTGWGWHLRPSTVTTPDLAMELCDGRPSFVQNDLDYWMSSVKQFCPWGAKVVARN